MTETEKIADLERKLAALEKKNAALAAQLDECRARREKLERNLDWQRALFSNPKLSATDKIVAVLATELWREASGPDAEPDPEASDDDDDTTSEQDDVEDMPVTSSPPVAAPKVIYLPRLAERAGVSEQTAGDSLRRLANAGGMHRERIVRRQKLTGQPVHRLAIAPTKLLAAQPELLASEKPRNHGGKRITCKECGGENIIRRTTVELICRDCATLLEKHVAENDANAAAEAQEAQEATADTSPTRNSTRDSQLDSVAAMTVPVDALQQTPARAEGWWTAWPWYDATRPDGVLSQALEWACGHNMVRAAAWMRSTQFIKRWNEGRVVTLKQGPLAPEAFIFWLREAYEERRHAEIQAVAKVLLVNREDVLAPDHGAARAEAAAERIAEEALA